MSKALGMATQFGSQQEDVDAIDLYMRTIPLKTPEAFQIKDAYIRWFDNSSALDKRFSDSWYDEQRTRRNQLNIANAANDKAAQENVRRVIATGIESEEMRGETRPRIDAQTGRVGTQVTKPTVAATPSTMPKPGSPSGPIVGPGNIIRATIRSGSTGKDVEAWQAIIGVPVTGTFDSATVAATKKWQKDHGLTADGIVGPKTWGAAAALNVQTEPVFIPPPKQAGVSFKPAPKPAPTPTTEPPPVQKAAIKAAGFLDFTTWPTWAKVVSAAATAGGIISLAMGKKPLKLWVK